MDQQVLEEDCHAHCTHKSLKKNYKNMSETQHFCGAEPFSNFDMNRKNLADYFHRLSSLKHLAETDRKLATKLTSAYAESYNSRIKRTPRKRTTSVGTKNAQ